MFKEKEFFVNIRPTKGTVLLGDGKTSINIEGIGTVKCLIDGHLTTLHNVRYIPGLGEAIYSLFLHIKTPDHGLETTTDQGLYIKIPGFQTKAIIGSTDIYLNAVPCSVNSSNPALLPSDMSSGGTTQPDTITAFQSNIQKETKKLDNILYQLCKYYATTKTKR
jgi:hypothetical protein